MGQEASRYLGFHFLWFYRGDGPGIYWEVTASGMVSQTMNEVIVQSIKSVPELLQVECFPTDRIVPELSFQIMNYLITDASFRPVAYVSYDYEVVNGVPFFVAWNVCAARSVRGQGLMAKVLGFSFEHLKTLNIAGYDNLALYVLKDNTVAQRLYTKLGFHIDPAYTDPDQRNWYRMTRALSFMPPTISPDEQRPLTNEQKQLLHITTPSVGEEERLKVEFRSAYVDALRKHDVTNTVSGLAERDLALAALRNKYQALSPSVMDAIIAGITLAEVMFHPTGLASLVSVESPDQAVSDNELEARRLALEREYEEEETKRELGRSASERLEGRFRAEFGDATEALWNALLDQETRVDQYVSLRDARQAVETKYARQLTPEEMKVVANEVQDALLDSGSVYREEWAAITEALARFESGLLSVSREVAPASIVAAFASTSMDNVLGTNFGGRMEHRLIGLAYLAHKHKAVTCAYAPQARTWASRIEDHAVVVKCDGQRWGIGGPADLLDQIRACRKPFFVVLLEIGHVDGGSLHENILIYDTEAKTMERFEPHGTASYGILEHVCYKTERVDAVVKEWINTTSNGAVVYVPPLDYCPSYQALQGAERKQLATDPPGFCVAWTLWYADIRLGNPTLSRRAVVELSKQFLTSFESLTTFIRNYADHVEKMVDRIRAFIQHSQENLSVPAWIVAHFHELVEWGKVEPPTG